MQTNNNKIFLRGRLAAPPALSHINHGVEYLLLPLSVYRLSGTEDTLHVVASREQLSALPPLEAGSPLTVSGEVRTFNNRSGVGSRLVLTVYAQSLQPGLDEPCNQILLSGALCKPPVFRRTPLGRSICDLMLAVPRRYGRADYLPVIAWGQLAVKASRLRVGDALALEGRVQSRTYHKALESGETEERTAYEVSAMRLLDPEGPDDAG